MDQDRNDGMKNIKTMAMALTLCSAVTCSSAAPVAGAGRFGYDDMKQGIFVPRTVQGVRSMNDGEHYTTMSDGKILEFSYGTGEQTAVVFDSKQQQLVLPFTDYAFSSDERRILLTTEVKPIYRRSFTAEYWIYDREEDRLIRLSAGGPQQVAQFSTGYTKRSSAFHAHSPGLPTERTWRGCGSTRAGSGSTT